jgi:hypothetical protein
MSAAAGPMRGSRASSPQFFQIAVFRSSTPHLIEISSPKEWDIHEDPD